MKNTARVIKILEDGMAEIMVLRDGACLKGCASCGGCPEKSKAVYAAAVNPLGADEGDFVIIETPTGIINKLAVLVYLFPLVVSILSIIWANSVFGSDVLNLAAFLVSFSLSCGLIYLFSKKIRIAPPQITQIIEDRNHLK